MKSEASSRNNVVWVSAGSGGGEGSDSWECNRTVSQGGETGRECLVRSVLVIWMASCGSRWAVAAMVRDMRYHRAEKAGLLRYVYGKFSTRQVFCGGLNARQNMVVGVLLRVLLSDSTKHPINAVI